MRSEKDGIGLLAKLEQGNRKLFPMARFAESADLFQSHTSAESVHPRTAY